MTDAPLLTTDKLADELRYIHRKDHRTRNTVLLARLSTLDAEVFVRDNAGGGQRFRVETARCELELRAALSDESSPDPVVVLVDWDPGRLPADLLGRVATGLVQTIGRARRIRGSFGNAQVTEDLLGCKPLVDAIVGDAQFRRPSPPGGVVTLDAAWRAFLVEKRIAGQESETEATLIARFAREPVPAGLAGYFAQRESLTEKLEPWLDASVGGVARWALRLWLAGRGPLAASLAFVLDGVRGSLGADDYVDGVLSTRLKELAASLGKGLPPITDTVLLKHWADLASILAVQLEARPSPLLRVLDVANDFLPTHHRVTDALSRSDYLRTALEGRKMSLANALTVAVRSLDGDSVRTVQQALDALTRHRLREADAGQGELFERARMAARLVGWLVARSRDVPRSATESDVVVLAERAEDFVRQGAFADHARRLARGGTADVLGEAIQVVVTQADARRDADDVEFTRALVTWNSLGRTPGRVLPIEHALDRYGARFLQGDPERRLLIVLLDGMAWANAVELLLSLENEHHAPLRWKVPGFDRAGVAPVIAALPTITDVSRAALFAGQLLKPGDGLDTSRDPVRLENHKTLRTPEDTPRLLLKARLQTASGDASPEALELVSSATRVVGVVVNAIDDQIKAGRQTRVTYELSTIKPLRDLLDRATLARRAVLLVADHGHVPGSRMERSRRRPDSEPGDSLGGARWRPVKGEARLLEGEAVFSGPYAWRPAGYDRLVVLTQEGDSYGHGVSEGEHGGVAMAEAIAPAILIGSDSLAERVKIARGTESVDTDLEVRPLARPDWWDLHGAPTATVPPVTRTPQTPRTRPETVAPQIPLAGITLEPAIPVALPRPPVGPSVWESFFARSKAVRELSRKPDAQFVKAVEALAEAGGTLSVDRLAQAVGVLASRVEGLVARMAETLNADGTQVLQYENATRLVRLDVPALEEIFT